MEPWAQPRPKPSPHHLGEQPIHQRAALRRVLLELHRVAEHRAFEHHVRHQLRRAVAAGHGGGFQVALGGGLFDEPIQLRLHLLGRHRVFHQAVPPAHEIRLQPGFVRARLRQIVEVAAVADAPGLQAFLGDAGKLLEQAAGGEGARGGLAIRVDDALAHRVFPIVLGRGAGTQAGQCEFGVQARVLFAQPSQCLRRIGRHGQGAGSGCGVVWLAHLAAAWHAAVVWSLKKYYHPSRIALALRRRFKQQTVVALERLAPWLPIRQRRIHQTMERLAVVHVPQMAELVDHDVFHKRIRQLRQVRIQRNAATARAASPAAAHEPMPPSRRAPHPRERGDAASHHGGQQRFRLCRVPRPDPSLGVCRRRQQLAVHLANVHLRRQTERERAAPKQQRRAVDILVRRPLAVALRSGETPSAHPAPVSAEHGANVVDAHMRWRFDVNDAVWREGEAEARPAAGVPRHMDLHGVAVFPGPCAPGIPSESQCAGDPIRPSCPTRPTRPLSVAVWMV